VSREKNDDDILSVADVIAETKVCRTFVYFALQSGFLQATQRKKGGRWYIKRSSMKKWMEGGCQTG